MKEPGLKLLDRFITLHRPDCEAIRPEAAALPGEDLSPLYEEDDARLRRPFDELKRLIGQVAGLLLLAEVSARREIVEAPTLMTAVERLREVSAAIEEVKPKLRNPAAVAAYPGIAEHIGQAINALRSSAETATTFEIGSALTRLKTAYNLLQRMAEPSRGRSMVDFSQACCSCNGAQPSVMTMNRGR